MTATTKLGTVIVEPVATHQVSMDYQSLFQQPTLTEFANKVGVMALLPYARQALQDQVSQVLGQPIVMPSFPRGAVTFLTPPAAGLIDPTAE
ncbi:hypothetical protein [Gephyromycinifex aptenodytis]|uniref:hypothetical protein n=1 Tax=Gephyromycinifex aptenodytis TaxID=2716227 RepID=UPI001445AFC1|nr:hypothetical protein [Gephyromycinifex aptenodytis]